MLTLKNIILAFIPIFVAVDAIGVMPVFINLTCDATKKEKTKVIFQSMLIAFFLSVGFLFLGKAIFRFLGITVGDFMVAGGLLLFSIAIIDILIPGKKRRQPIREVAAVPLGTPLIVGPAVLTTSLILLAEYGIFVLIISITLNILIAGFVFSVSDSIIKIIGNTGAKVLSKIVSLFLAAIAVMMIRKGLVLLSVFF